MEWLDGEGYAIDTCAVCQKNQSSASNLTNETFKVNTANKCGHKFCSSCIERELSKKRQFACPRCKIMVSRDKLSDKSLEETEAEKDFLVRRKLKAIYNKKEADFATLHLFNDYEEMVEDFIHNLVTQTEVERTNEAIQRYIAENSETITINEFQKVEDLKHVYSSIRTQEDDKREKDLEFQKSFRQELQQKKEHKRQLNQTMLGGGDGVVTCGFISNSAAVTAAQKTAAAATAAAAAAAAASFNNPVLMFLSQRPEPVPLLARSEQQAAQYKTKKRVNKDKKLTKRLDGVGGYDYADYEKRNWAEITLHLGGLTTTTTSTTATGATAAAGGAGIGRKR